MKPEVPDCEVYHRILAKADLAKALRVSLRTIENWQDRGILVPIKIGGVVRFDWDDVVAQLTKYRGGMPDVSMTANGGPVLRSGKKK